jgi:predicted flavoprotein YhiN
MQLNNSKKAIVYLDLKPSLGMTEIRDRLLSHKKNISWTKHLENQLKLTKVQLSLLKNSLNKEDFLNPAILVDKIKNLPLTIHSMAPLDDAISTVGGIALHELDSNYQLKKIPDQYAIGEMLDWDAPTGGYLLQACFSMGKHVAQHLNKSGVNKTT